MFQIDSEIWMIVVCLVILHVINYEIKSIIVGHVHQCVHSFRT